jgi:TM2 domain-containing membrane protein YozV
MTQQYTNAPVQIVAPKTVGTAYILWAFFSILGVHQFYMGKTGRGLSMLFTLGWLGVGAIVDLFTMETQVAAVNRRNGITMQYLQSR